MPAIEERSLAQILAAELPGYPVSGKRKTTSTEIAGKPADPKAILGQYLQGKKTAEIAKAYGVSRQALGYWLRQHAEEDWRQAQVVLATHRKEDAEEALDSAKRTSSPLALARARERLKAAQWDLERVCRRIYGDSGAPVVSADQLETLLVRVSSRMLQEKQVNALPHDNKRSAASALESDQ
jgi:transposase-like protein